MKLQRIPRSIARLAAGLLLTLVGARASSTAFWEMNAYADFLRGKFSGISLSRDGRLLLAPKTTIVFDTGQPAVWSVAEGPDHSLYLGTGHRGRLYRLDPAGNGSLLWTAPEPEIFAVTVDAAGIVYAGTSPDGKVYRIENGKAAEYFAPQSRYVWALAAGPDGVLYVGTGDQGKVFRVTAAGKGEVYYETGQSNVTALAIDGQGRLLAGSEPNGILYRITAKEKAFVLYDASLPEIRAIVPQPDGAIYAAALGGSVAKRASSIQNAAGATPAGALVSGVTTTITVTDESAQAGLEIKPKADGKQAQTSAPQQNVLTPLVTEVAGVDKSALYRINGDNTVETLWTSKEENIYDLLPSGPQIFFGTDGQGRIYRLGADRKVTLVLQTNDGEATRLIASGSSLLAATSTMGKLYRIEQGSSPAGSYEAPVHDAGGVALWGNLSWRTEPSNQSGIVFRTRSGNSARPDKTWSDWSEPVADARGSRITSPNARYLQWRAEFSAAAAGSPVLSGVTAAYLPQNTPPVVKSINVVSVANPQAAAAKAAAAQTASATPTYSITVTDTGESGASSLSGTPTQTLARTSQQQIQITWTAEDPDNDRLTYALYYRAEDEQRWKLLRANMSENSLALDAEALADGKYYFRLMVSDRASNPPATARDAEMISAPILIDNTPPVVTAKLTRYEGGTAEIDIEASDAASALRRAEYSLDANAWVPLAAVDGVIDSQRERMPLKLEKLPAGEHVVVIRAFDTAGNVGLTKVVLP